MPDILLNANAHPASFRDRSGFIFRDGEGRLCRQINSCYFDDYQALMESGLCSLLTEKQWLVAHEEAPFAESDLSRVIYPAELPFISYPYEWSFSMLKDAALLTLKIQREALAHGMSLKDATSYNVQFRGSHAVFIDTLSFERYEEGKPWIAYGQFCQHFLAPLALMSYRDIRLNSLMASHLDGIPLDMAVSLLPWRAKLRPGLLLHLWLHSKAVRRHQATNGSSSKPEKRGPGKQSLLRIVESLEGAIQSLRWDPKGTEWIDYYSDCTYTEAMRDSKAQWLKAALEQVQPTTVWDLGANTGLYSRIARDVGAIVLSLDIDPACVERNYLQAWAQKEERILPLCMDLTNPSAGRGWAHRERSSFTDRGPADAILALALIHHLALGNNLPLPMIAEWFASLGRHAVVEFVPKSDPQSQRLLQSREDIFSDYTAEAFEEAMSAHFRLVDQQEVPSSDRVLYLFEIEGS